MELSHDHEGACPWLLREALSPLRSSTIVLVDTPRPYQANLYTSSGTEMDAEKARVRNPKPWNILDSSAHLSPTVKTGMFSKLL